MGRTGCSSGEQCSSVMCGTGDSNLAAGPDGVPPSAEADAAARQRHGRNEPVGCTSDADPEAPLQNVVSLATRGSLSPHYDSSKDIVLRHEFVGAGAVKTAILIVWLVLAMALALQETNPPSHFFTSSAMFISNTCIASLLMLASTVMLAHFLWRISRSNRCGKRWTHRRKRLVTMAGIELSLQILNSVMFLVPNAYVLAKECSWFSGVVTWSAFIRWSTWNTSFLIYWIEAANWQPVLPTSPWYVERLEEPGMSVVMDAPLWRHWHKGVVWVAIEGFALALCITTYNHLRSWNQEIDEEGAACHENPYVCNMSAMVLVLIILVTVGIGCYAVMYARAMRRSFHSLQRLPYNEYKQANYVLRIAVRQRATAIAFFFLSMVVYTFIGFTTCKSYVLSWLGYMPSMMVMVCSAIANGYMMTPKRPNNDGILQVWLQEFAWTEGDEERKKKGVRASSLPPDSASTAAIDKEPMFCFETALKAMYWSFLVYDHEEVPGSPYSVPDALNLYDLQHFELHWDPKGMDTKTIVGWNSDTVVIAFRGTASMANIKADVQMWRTGWPPGHGRQLLCSAPMVHWGFHRAWTANGFRERIMNWLQQHLQPSGSGAGGMGCKPLHVLVTGHSLGGALATLCAFDIAQQFPESTVRVKCYTFGAPRTGNHAFARLYNEAVPDTWQLSNNDDVVVHGGKFFVLYKRPGHRVLINKLGDMVVRPNYIETAIRKVPGAASLRDHLLTSYQVAIASVLGVQFSSKRFIKGREGVLRLAQQKGGAVVLEAVGLAHDTLTVLQEQGWEALLDLRRRSKQTRTLLPSWALLKIPGSSSGVALEELVLADGCPASEHSATAAEEPKPDDDAVAAAAVDAAQMQASRISSLPRGLPPELERLTSRGPFDRSVSPLDQLDGDLLDGGGGEKDGLE